MAEMDEKQAQNWGMLCHIAGLTALIPLVGIVAGPVTPLVIWLVKREEHPFIDEQGKEAVNFQITMCICGIIASLLYCLGVGIILGVVLFIFILVFVIIAAIKVSNGEHYRYPVTLRLVK